jgi:hypothetical protein
MKSKQAALAKAKAEADINPNLIEVTERVVIKEEKVKDPIPDVEWWYVLFICYFIVSCVACFSDGLFVAFISRFSLSVI